LEKDPETAMRIAAALRYFWSNHSHLTEGRRWLEEALERSENAPSIRYLKLLNGLGQFARYQSDFETARKVYEKAITAGKAANELAQIGIAYHGLAALATQKGNFEEAQKFNEVELAIYREINDKSGIAFALASLGDLALAKGEASSARPVIEESLKISRELGNKQIASINLVNLGMVAFSEKDYETAFSHFMESLLLAQELGNKAVISCSLDGFAALAEWHGDAEQAAKLAGAADRLRESIDFDKEPSERLFCEAYISKTRARLGEQTFIAEFEKGRKMGWCEAASLAVRKSEIFFDQTEIIIESHKFERVIIEEEIENVNDKRRQ
jgi:non-specific serine/threonine protein kinase